MYQDIEGVATMASSPTLWCSVKCITACTAACVIDGPGPSDVYAWAGGFVSWGGK